MKKKYNKIGEFIKDVMTPERIKIARDNTPSYRERQDGEFSLEEFQGLVQEIGRYSDYEDKTPPFGVPLYENDHDTDHDHGAWTDRCILEIDDEGSTRFYEIELCYYGQGDFDDEGTEWRSVQEVFPKSVTVIKYEYEK